MVLIIPARGGRRLGSRLRVTAYQAVRGSLADAHSFIHTTRSRVIGPPPARMYTRPPLLIFVCSSFYRVSVHPQTSPLSSSPWPSVGHPCSPISKLTSYSHLSNTLSALILHTYHTTRVYCPPCPSTYPSPIQVQCRAGYSSASVSTSTPSQDGASILSSPVVPCLHLPRLGSYGGQDSPLDISRVRRVSQYRPVRI